MKSGGILLTLYLAVSLSLLNLYNCQSTELPAEHRLTHTELPNFDAGNVKTDGPYSDPDHPIKGLINENGSVQCYNCSTHPKRDGQACADNYQSFLTTCPENSTGCWRIEQWVDYDQDMSDIATMKHHYVIRGCAWLGNPNKPCYYKAGFGGRQNVCFCQGDKCNSASGLIKSLIAIALEIIMVLYLIA